MSNKLFISSLLIILISGCSSQRNSSYKFLYLKNTSKKTVILPEIISGLDCKQRVKEYAINDAIVDASKSKYPQLVGLANVQVTESIESFLLNINKCFKVQGHPIVETDSKSK